MCLALEIKATFRRKVSQLGLDWAKILHVRICANGMKHYCVLEHLHIFINDL